YRNHRIDWHNAGLHRLPHWASPNDPGSDLLNRVEHFTRNRTLAIQGFSQSIYDPPQQSHAYGYLQQLAGGADFIAFLKKGVVAQDDHSDFCFLEIKRQASDAVAQVQHFVEHCVRKPLDSRDAISDFANHADVSLSGGWLDARNLSFDFF